MAGGFEGRKERRTMEQRKREMLRRATSDSNSRFGLGGREKVGRKQRAAITLAPVSIRPVDDGEK